MIESNKPLIKFTPDEKRRISKLAGYLTIATKFLSAANDAYTKSKFRSAIEAAAPWSKAIAESLGPVVAPLKLLNFILERLANETDPVLVGHLACTMAYEKAIKQALEVTAGPEGAFDEARAELTKIEQDEEVDLSTFDISTPFAHEFTRQADLRFQAAAMIVGYTNAQIENLTAKVHDLFPHCINQVLTDVKTREKLAPFREYTHLRGAQKRKAFRERQEHLKYQQFLYGEAPVLGKSPFALRHVYVDMDCGVLTWKKIRESKERIEANRGRIDEVINPFTESEQSGGRQPLLETVMDLIADPDMKEAIIIQGIAGAGKSSFTLRLCSALQNEHMHPIWVRLKELDLSRHIEDALPAAIRLSDGRRATDDIFEGGGIFTERGIGRFEKICRYVLIFDGWDEISVSDEGFQKRINRMLEQVRNVYLNGSEPLIRVILTGRLASEITESAFLRDRTPILTLRPMPPDRLKQYVHDIAMAVMERPIKVDSDGDNVWRDFDQAKFEGFIKQYSIEFETLSRDAKSSNKPPPLTDRMSGSVIVLGLPLLAHLTIRLISEWKGNAAELVQNPTTLYRNLINLTCEKGGKAHDVADEKDEIRTQHRILGDKLRRLLQQTAAAMYVFGEDLISYEELSSRLRLEGHPLKERVAEITKEHKLSSLMISFYFKGGYEHLGCEFVHKSFREYLFAEAIVEALKSYGRDAVYISSPLEERPEYWRDFDQKDVRYLFSRQVSELLAPQWLNLEIVNHIETILKWEIARAAELGMPNELNLQTDALDLKGWRRVREGLADLWDWWGDAVHLRPQSVIEGRRNELKYKEPYGCELIDYSTPLVTRDRNPKLIRTTTIDAHLGDGLFRLCALVHHFVAVSEGWPDVPGESKSHLSLGHPLKVMPDFRQGTRRYQAIVGDNKQNWTLFAPSGKDTTFFANYAHRINSAGWRPGGRFPSHSTLRGTILMGANLSGEIFDSAIFNGAILNRAILNRASLRRASLINASLGGANLDGANLIGTILDRANLNRASLIGANLNRASLIGASLNRASLNRASLNRASLNRASLNRAVLDGASLNNTSLINANLDSASLNNTSLINANLDSASLDHAILDGAILNNASLKHAILSNTIFDGASLDDANLDGASLINASLSRANLDGANLDGANLDGANLDGASLIGASLIGASLNNASLDNVNLSGANLSGANLSAVRHCAWKQIETARIDVKTILPIEFEAYKRNALSQR